MKILAVTLLMVAPYIMVGEAFSSDCDCNMHPSQYNPVCGGDGNIYFSKCTFNCENLWRIKHGMSIMLPRDMGYCCKCSNKWDPLCASDNRTYRNWCRFRCENDTRARFGLPPITVKWWGPC